MDKVSNRKEMTAAERALGTIAEAIIVLFIGVLVVAFVLYLGILLGSRYSLISLGVMVPILMYIIFIWKVGKAYSIETPKDIASLKLFGVVVAMLFGVASVISVVINIVFPLFNKLEVVTVGGIAIDVSMLFVALFWITEIRAGRVQRRISGASSIV
jgi:hypothetical protein